MKTHKTPMNQRTTYKQYDEEGHLLCEFKPAEEGLTDIEIEENKVKINKIHRMEDAEVRVHIKENRLPAYLEEEGKRRKVEWIADFEKKYGYKPHPADVPDFTHKSFVSTDAEVETDEGSETLGDNSRIALKMSVNPFEDEPESAAEYMRRLVMTGDFTQRQREVYDLVFIQGKEKSEAAELLGISAPRVTQIIEGIMKKVATDNEMKKMFR